MSEMNIIDFNYPLEPGTWDIAFTDLENKTMCIMRYIIITATPIKEVMREGMQITGARRMR
jgi:hypothetical protein